MTQGIVILYKELQDTLLVTGLQVVLGHCTHSRVLPALCHHLVNGILEGVDKYLCLLPLINQMFLLHNPLLP